jgi:hypothetical protein
MCVGGSLFALHLATEGRILHDPRGLLAQTLAKYRAPVSYEPVWNQLELMAEIVGTERRYLPPSPLGVVRLALYLVRTAAIVEHIERFGQPCFSLPVLAEHLGRPNLDELFARREDPRRLRWHRLSEARAQLASLLGHATITNPHGSLEAFAVNVDPASPLAAHAALRLLGGSDTIGYGDLLLDVLIPGNV